MHLRNVSTHKLWGAYTALHLVIVYAMWSCQLGPAMRELRNVRRELDIRSEHQSAHDTVRGQLKKIQNEVHLLRRELDKTVDLGDPITHSNRSFSYLETIAARSGLRIRTFEAAGQSFSQIGRTGFSKVVLEGTFSDVVKFVEALAGASALLRLDTFEASVTAEMPETISLSLTFADVMEVPHASRLCEVGFS